MNTNTPGRTGFTLLELLIVMIVIAVLAGLLLPAVANARKRAQNVNCVNNLRQMWQGIILYASDHDNCTPFVVEPPPGGDPTDRNNFPNSFFNIMCPNYLTPDVFICPVAVSGTPGASRAEWKTTYEVLGANGMDVDKPPMPWDGKNPFYDEKGYDQNGNYNYRVYTPLDGRPMAYLHTVYLRPIIRDMHPATDDKRYPHPYRQTKGGTAQAGDSVANALHADTGGRMFIAQENKSWSSLLQN